jgi:hypothetical protein
MHQQQVAKEGSYDDYDSGTRASGEDIMWVDQVYMWFFLHDVWAESRSNPSIR